MILLFRKYYIGKGLNRQIYANKFDSIKAQNVRLQLEIKYDFPYRLCQLTFSWIFPFVFIICGNDFFDGVKLAIYFSLCPVVPYLFSNLGKDRVFTALRMPCGKVWETVCFMKYFWPVKDSWQHEFHEDGGREPSQIRMCNPITSKIWSFAMFLQPGELLPNLSKLLRSLFQLHYSFSRAPSSYIRGQIHATLCVSKAWLGTIW